MKKDKGAASEGLVVILFFLVFISAFAFMINGFITEGAKVNGISVNNTVMSNVNMYEKTNSTLESMKQKFIDEKGNARTGVTDIINTLFTGIGGIITVLFSVPQLFANFISQIAVSLGLPGGELVNLAVFGLIALAIITTVYMISRR